MSDASRKRVVIAAGGTGGHLFPAQALAEDLVRRGHDIVLITDSRGRTYADAFPDADIRMVSAATFAGRGPLGKLKAAGSIIAGIGEAWSMLGRLAPSAVIGFGGYPALPAMVGAALRGIPICIHEQNAVLGRVNRVIAGRVDLIASAFEGLERVPSSARGKVIVTGNPIREVIADCRKVPYAAPREGEPVRLLIFGGSQGARIFGQVMPQALRQLDPALRARLHVTQQVREEDMETVAATYRDAGIEADLSPFFTDMARRLSDAHLVVARAGASSVTELAVVGRPGLLIPLPGAMDDHQTVNARVLERAGGGWLMPEPGFTADAVAARLAGLLADPATLTAAAKAAHASGQPGATRLLADIVEGLTKDGHAYARARLAQGTV